jgi:hypothetical protein
MTFVSWHAECVEKFKVNRHGGKMVNVRIMTYAIAVGWNSGMVTVLRKLHGHLEIVGLQREVFGNGPN